MHKLSSISFVVTPAILIVALVAAAEPAQAQIAPIPTAVRTTSSQQGNVPAAAQRAEGAVENTVRRFRIGVEGGVGLDPELIMFGAHGSFGPIFHPQVSFRPGLEFGIGEVTTLLGINLEVLYTLPGSTGTTRWTPYFGVGPNFALSHRGFESDEESDDDAEDEANRFDFSDTDFESGFNFIVGARAQNGLFIEMKATAYGVSNIRLLAGFNF